MSRNHMSECWECRHKREIPGDCHISCSNPSAAVMATGSLHGIKKGWFCYPFNFDPVWKTQLCENFEYENPVVSPAISQAVSQEKA